MNEEAAHARAPAELATSGTVHEFTKVVTDLATPGVLATPTTTFAFRFPAVALPHESYDGMNGRCRYFVRVTVSRGSYLSALTKDIDFLVRNVEEVRGRRAAARRPLRRTRNPPPPHARSRQRPTHQ